MSVFETKGDGGDHSGYYLHRPNSHGRDARTATVLQCEGTQIHRLAYHRCGLLFSAMGKRTVALADQSQKDDNTINT